MLQDKLREKFKVLEKPKVSMKIRWKDGNGEELDIDDSEDLDNAIEEMGGSENNLWIVYEDEDEKGKTTYRRKAKRLRSHLSKVDEFM